MPAPAAPAVAVALQASARGAELEGCRLAEPAASMSCWEAAGEAKASALGFTPSVRESATEEEEADSRLGLAGASMRPEEVREEEDTALAGPEEGGSAETAAVAAAGRGSVELAVARSLSGKGKEAHVSNKRPGGQTACWQASVLQPRGGYLTDTRGASEQSHGS